MGDNSKYRDIDSLLGGLFKPPTLKELFEEKLAELNMPPTTASHILGIGYKPLKRLLESTETTVDIIKLFKLADFLQLPKDRVVKIYTESLERNQYQITEATSPEKVKFIKENFDLAILKKAGFLESISDFGEIERRILSRLGLRSIFEYKRPPVDIAFSAGSINTEYHSIRAFWIQSAINCFTALGNPYSYSRDGLVKYFPQIRWHSMNQESGLGQVVKSLFKLGITVIFQPPLQNLKVWGATFIVNERPCIVLSNYYEFYPTLWFTLIHELYHVLFDLDDIRQSRYHLSDDSNEQASVRERELLANNFSREYLFSKQKLEEVKANMREHHFVKEYALNNHVDPSIVYAFYAFDQGKVDRMAWARVRRYSPPTVCTQAIGFEWKEKKEVDEIAKSRRMTIYN